MSQETHMGKLCFDLVRYKSHRLKDEHLFLSC